jgi:hypothetical protein
MAYVTDFPLPRLRISKEYSWNASINVTTGIIKEDYSGARSGRNPLYDHRLNRFQPPGGTPILPMISISLLPCKKLMLRFSSKLSPHLPTPFECMKSNVGNWTWSILSIGPEDEIFADELGSRRNKEKGSKRNRYDKRNLEKSGSVTVREF